VCVCVQWVRCSAGAGRQAGRGTFTELVPCPGTGPRFRRTVVLTVGAERSAIATSAAGGDLPAQIRGIMLECNVFVDTCWHKNRIFG
jgi:hypothetical protein